MADIKNALPILYKAEFSRPENALHVNKTETGYTFMGIYQTAHPTWSGWGIVRDKLKQYGGDIKLASSMLYDNEKMRELVEFFYKRNFWDRAKLDRVNSQHIANEIFIFGVVADMPPAIKKAQQLVGVTADGNVGEKTLTALNSFDEKAFDLAFDEKEIEYFKTVISLKPEKEVFLKGWINRAHLV
ncbi:MAG: peptidoglycan domain protein [Epsilonproteobacteria bacterium]|nr:peptidoglycan domain protein [Campylobacterota bacterium]